MKWRDLQAPDDEGETHERSDSGENFIAKFLPVKPPFVVGIRSGESMDAEIARRGVLNGEENGEIVEEVVNGWFDRVFRRNRR